MDSSNGNDKPSGKRCVPNNKIPPRIVPGFCAQVNQKNTKPAGPKKILPPNTPTGQARRGSSVATKTMFAVDYGRPGFPLAAFYGSTKDNRPFRWLVPLESIDYATYLPILTDGLREPPMPYGQCAAHSLWDLLARDTTGDRVLSALPKIMFPLRRALDAGSDNWPVVVRALKTLQKLTTVGNDRRVGEALVPYYRLLLRPLDRYRQATDVYTTDGVTQKLVYNVADLCEETLSQLQYMGGPCAFLNIKYMIPTYERVIVCCPKPTAPSLPKMGFTLL